MKDLKDLTRSNIWNLTPYSSARDEYKGDTQVTFLDANENPYSDPYNRYPDPTQNELKGKISKIKGIPVSSIFLGNGSDEAIDLLFRVFCQPQIDNVVAIAPTYGMYKVCADINEVEYRSVLLDDDFQFTAESLLAATDEQTKLIFLCSPNNPTGNDLNREEISKLLDSFDGLVVVDEAYIDFSNSPSFIHELTRYPNLIILQTFSKALGSAAIRLGMAFASPEIIQLMSRVKYPYNVSQLTQNHALDILEEYATIKKWTQEIIEERTHVENLLEEIPCVLEIYPSDANFILIKVTDANAIYDYLVRQGVIIRNRHSVTLCENCLRITIGTPEENTQLLNFLQSYK
ncbi:MAG: histidinol-phosphate transaminase [Bacteroidales bacterium]|nr:histidinol-phosphate transaminase [Bacteroidales bacterium]